jgi:WD40-like Beta Propeller Repeat
MLGNAHTGAFVSRLTTNDAAIDFDPDFSPDGTQIAFQSDRDGDDEIFVMDVDGMHKEQLTFNGGEDWAPAWSPDGQRIVYQRVPSHQPTGIFVMTRTGKRIHRLTRNPNPNYYQSPDWRPIPSAGAPRCEGGEAPSPRGRGQSSIPSAPTSKELMDSQSVDGGEDAFGGLERFIGPTDVPAPASDHLRCAPQSGPLSQMPELVTFRRPVPSTFMTYTSALPCFP